MRPSNPLYRQNQVSVLFHPDEITLLPPLHKIDTPAIFIIENEQYVTIVELPL